MIHATGKVAETVAKGLAGHPVGLAVVTINVLALALVGYVLWVVADRTSARDALITQLARDCVVAPKEAGK